jgi:hypothetical protein
VPMGWQSLARWGRVQPFPPSTNSPTIDATGEWHRPCTTTDRQLSLVSITRKGSNPMERMFVVVFDSEDEAYKGPRALQVLDEDSSIARANNRCETALQRMA